MLRRSHQWKWGGCLLSPVHIHHTLFSKSCLFLGVHELKASMAENDALLSRSVLLNVYFWHHDVKTSVHCLFCAHSSHVFLCFPQISAPHLVRSYHHLFPVPEFLEVKSTTQKTLSLPHELLFISYNHRFPIPHSFECFGCTETMNIEKNLVNRCGKCNHVFCIECDVYIHESLHNCPGCLSRPQ